MFDVNLFNGAQILDQMIDFLALYLLTSQSAKTRFYGFALGLAGFAPRHIPGCCHRDVVAGALLAGLAGDRIKRRSGQLARRARVQGLRLET